MDKIAVAQEIRSLLADLHGPSVSRRASALSQLEGLADDLTDDARFWRMELESADAHGMTQAEFAVRSKMVNIVDEERGGISLAISWDLNDDYDYVSEILSLLNG